MHSSASLLNFNDCLVELQHELQSFFCNQLDVRELKYISDQIGAQSNFLFY